MKQQANIKSFDGTVLYLRKDMPENCRAVVVIVHGLCEHHKIGRAHV